MNAIDWLKDKAALIEEIDEVDGWEKNWLFEGTLPVNMYNGLMRELHNRSMAGQARWREGRTTAEYTVAFINTETEWHAMHVEYRKSRNNRKVTVRINHQGAK